MHKRYWYEYNRIIFLLLKWKESTASMKYQGLRWEHPKTTRNHNLNLTILRASPETVGRTCGSNKSRRNTTHPPIAKTIHIMAIIKDLSNLYLKRQLTILTHPTEIPWEIQWHHLISSKEINQTTAIWTPSRTANIAADGKNPTMFLDSATTPRRIPISWRNSAK